MAETADCAALQAENTCAYRHSGGPIAWLISARGDVRVLSSHAATQVAGNTPLAPGDGVVSGDGQAVFDGGPECTFPIDRQIWVSTSVQDACVIVSVTELIIPGIDPRHLLFKDDHTALAVVGLGAGAAALLLLRDDTDEQPVTPP